MNSEELLRAGKLAEAIGQVGAELRSAPTDAKRRIFLFELLCFAGEYERAQKHLDYLAGGGQDATMGALVYHAALHAERTRQAMFTEGKVPPPPEEDGAIRGKLNGVEFSALADADARLGARLEVFAAGSYLLVPWKHVEYLEIPAPKRLRDLLWPKALLRTGPGFRGVELGEVILPALAPLSWKHPDETVRLGRMTVWEEEANGEEVLFGQKMLLVDSAETPFLEVRTIEITQPAE